MTVYSDLDGRIFWRESRAVALLSRTKLRLILSGREALFFRAGLALFIFCIAWTVCLCALMVTGHVTGVAAAILTPLLFGSCYFALVEYCTTEFTLSEGLTPLPVQPRGPDLLVHIRVLPAALMTLGLSLPTERVNEVIRVFALAPMFVVLMLYVGTALADRWREARS